MAFIFRKTLIYSKVTRNEKSTFAIDLITM